MTATDSSRYVLPILVAIVTAIYLYIPPYNAWEPNVVPDEVEYAAAAHTLATTGTYTISINGRAYPPRYPPGFSALVLAPIYWLAPGDVGNGVWAVLAFAVIAAVAAFFLGRRLGGDWGGVLAAIMLVHYKDFAQHSRLIMTDVPVAAIGLLCALLYLRMRRVDPLWTYALAACLAGFASALRPLAVFLVLPFALLAISRPRRRVGFMAVLLLPIIAVSAGNTLYDFHAFGAWSSTGYHFWRSIPYDYPSLVFSPWFLTQNLMVLWTFKGAAMILALAFVGWLSLKKQPPDDLRHYLRYALLAAGPISFIHLWYAWTTVRFHFVGLALLVVLAAAGIARWIPQSVQRQKWLLVAALAVSPVFPPRMRIPLPVRRQLGEQIARLTPADAVIVSAIPAPFLETLISQPGNHRLIVPPDRQWKDDVYANMIINTANARVDPLAASDANGRAALIAQGASYVHPFTADEGMDQLSAWAAAGRPLFVDFLTTNRDGSVGQDLGRRFRLAPVNGSAELFQLFPPAPAASAH